MANPRPIPAAASPIKSLRPHRPASRQAALAPVEQQIRHYTDPQPHTPPPGSSRWGDRFATTPTPSRARPHRARPGGATDSPLHRPPAAYAPTGLAPVEQQIRHYTDPQPRTPPPGLPRWSNRFATTPTPSRIRPHRACPGGATDSSLRRPPAAYAPTGLVPVERQIRHYTDPQPHTPPPGLPRWSDRFVTTRGNVVASLRFAAHGTPARGRRANAAAGHRW